MYPFGCQRGNYTVMEKFAARMYGTVIGWIEVDDLANWPRTDWVPIGTVEFCRAVMAHQGINPPAPLSYPPLLQPFLKRRIWTSTAGQVRRSQDPVFVKPQQTKQFTGFVWPGDEMAQNEFASIPDDTKVWCSEVIRLQNEWRIYVCNHQILGMARYDDNDTEDLPPDNSIVQKMVDSFAAAAPAGYSLDVGINDANDTVLVEVNDGWALGLYKGFHPAQYLTLIEARWKELLDSAPVTD